MAHHGGPLVELADHLGGVVGNLLQGLPCEDLRVGAGFLDRFRVVRPRGRYTRVAVLLEQTDPVVPAARQQPEPVDEDDRRLPARVGLIDLALLALGDLGHGVLLPGRRVAPPDKSTPVESDHNRSDHAYRGPTVLLEIGLAAPHQPDLRPAEAGTPSAGPAIDTAFGAFADASSGNEPTRRATAAYLDWGLCQAFGW